MGLGTIYLVCAVAGGTVLVIRLILMLFGLDTGEASIDIDHDGIADAGNGSGGFLTFLSLQSIAGFFTMFGLVGMGLLQVNASDIWSLLGALGAGVFTAWATGMIFLGMRRLQSEGTLQIENAVGKTGTVYLTVPESGTGLISISVQGALRTLDAKSESGQRIPTGSIVKVVGITAGNVLVVASDSPAEKEHKRSENA